MATQKRIPVKFTPHGGGVLSRPRADGKVVYYIRYRWHGRSVVEKVGLKEETARDRRWFRREQSDDPNWVPPTLKKREEMLRSRKAKEAAEPAAKPAQSFADLIEVYKTECAAKRRRADWQGWMLDLVKTEFGGVALAEMTPERIEAWRDKLTESGKSPSTVRKYVYFVSGIYADSMKTAAGRKLVQENPCRLVSLPPEPKGLRKALTADQAAEVLRAAGGDAPIYRWASLILTTGMRVEEAQRLQWEHVELERKGKLFTSARFAVHETKTGRPRYVEVGAQLLPDLGRWRKADGPEPIGSLIGEDFESFPYPRWRDVFKAAEIPWGTGREQFTTRNLRTTFCMLAFQNGARPEELVQQTGHSLETLFGFYAEASRDQRRRAVDALPNLKRRTLKAIK